MHHTPATFCVLLEAFNVAKKRQGLTVVPYAAAGSGLFLKNDHVVSTYVYLNLTKEAFLHPVPARTWTLRLGSDLKPRTQQLNAAAKAAGREDEKHTGEVETSRVHLVVTCLLLS